jgi:hypothetical protein
MTALELLTVLCAVAALAIAVVLALVVGHLLRVTRRFEASVRDFEQVAIPAAAEIRDAAVRAVSEVDRVEDLLEVATAIGQRVDSATEVTYRALTSPVIKGVAIASGTKRAAGRLRGRRGDDPVAAVGRDRRQDAGAEDRGPG